MAREASIDRSKLVKPEQVTDLVPEPRCFVGTMSGILALHGEVDLDESRPKLTTVHDNLEGFKEGE